MTEYIQYVESDLIPNCLSRRNTLCAQRTFWAKLWKSEIKNDTEVPRKAVLNTLDSRPNVMLDEYGDATIAINIMYINQIPFMMTASWAIHFGTAEIIQNEKTSTIIKSLQQIIDMYHGRGFIINTYSEINNFNMVENTWNCRAYMWTSQKETNMSQRLTVTSRQ